MSNIENLEDFKTTLDSFKDLKSGISGSRIKKLTTYALEHVSDEKNLIQSIIDYARNCNNSHKLGALYIIDSVGRAYLDEARAKDQYIKSTASEGTFAHGVFVLGENIQNLLEDSINKSDSDHKEKIRMLIDIWDRSGLFQKSSLNAIRATCFSVEDIPNPSQKQPETNTEQSLEDYPDAPTERVKYILSNLSKYDFSGVPEFVVPSLITSTDPAERDLALQQLLTEMNQKFAFVERQTQEVQNTDGRAHVHVTTEYGSRRAREKQSKDTNPRSPRMNNARVQSNPNDENQYYNSNTAEYDGLRHNRDFGTNNHHLYPDETNVPQNPHYRPKPVSYDNSLPPDTIKVYSRTLFIGGVPMNMKEWDLANLIRPFAEVQSVILNHGRKHAFVKVYSRIEAENAFRNFNKDGALPLRTRWGVGFGPRDCCDYQTGSSKIPLHRLTDADKKWSVEAQWGGTGGQPLETGIVFEEPDIIVGEGISSKSMSQKMPTDSNLHGPSSRSELQYNNGPNMYNQGVVPPHVQQGMYGQVPPPPPPQMVQGQPDMYNSNNTMSPVPPANPYPQMTSAPPPVPQTNNFQQETRPPVEGQSNIDPTAQLNSLMSMINQQQQQQQQ